MDRVGFLFGFVDLEYACCYLWNVCGVQESCVEVVFVVHADIWCVFVFVSF